MGKKPTLLGAVTANRGPLLALLVLTAFAASMQANYAQDRASADLAQAVLLADQVLNRTCWPGGASTTTTVEEPGSIRCASGARPISEVVQRGSPPAQEIAGISRLFGIWRFKWKIELLEPDRHLLWMKSETLQALTKSQAEMAKRRGDTGPAFFLIYADLDNDIQPRPDRHGVLLITTAYRERSPNFEEPISKLGPSLAVSSWFFSREFRLFGINSLEAGAIEIAREAGHASKRADEAYAALTAAVARSAVTVPLINVQLPPRLAAFALLLSVLAVQLYARLTLNGLPPISCITRRRSARLHAQTWVLLTWVYRVCSGIYAVLPLLTAYWAFDLLQWAPFRSQQTASDSGFGIAFLILSAVMLFVSWNVFRLGFEKTSVGES